MALLCASAPPDAWGTEDAASFSTRNLQAENHSGPKHLDAAILLDRAALSGPAHTAAFRPPANPGKPANILSGQLVFSARTAAGFRVIKDDFNRLSGPAPALELLPTVTTQWVQSGNDIIPRQRTPQTSDHPYWEWVFAPGKAWDEPGDQGLTRAAIPFSLQQRNQNCTHHGMLTFLFRSDGYTSDSVFQVVSETCIWLKADFWGRLGVHFQPDQKTDTSAIATGYREEIEKRLPVQPITRLEVLDQAANIDLFRPEKPEDATVWGLVANGVHYIGGCHTRHGPYPFCEQLVLPSYSLAKSVFLGLGFLQLRDRYPGMESERVTDWIPECRLADQRWEGVELRHLVDMTSGLYHSTKFMDDENRITRTDFIQGETQSDKLAFACEEYPRNANAGERWVYHTSDSYLAGLLMTRFLRARLDPAADLLEETWLKSTWKDVGLSPLSTYSKRTYDAARQPFAGYGLSFHPDDVARLGQWLNGSAANEHDSGRFHSLFRNSADTAKPDLAPLGLNYHAGTWAAQAKQWVGCDDEVWIPFFSGFGGITVALLPNGMVYYYFSDSGIFKWAKPVIEAHRMKPICDH